MRSILSAVAAVVVMVVPASAMNWVRYAPDTPNMYLDTDSIYTRGDYTYFTFGYGSDDSPPTSPGGNRMAINCATGQTMIPDENGNWQTSYVWGRDAWLYKAVCHL